MQEINDLAIVLALGVVDCLAISPLRYKLKADRV